MSEITAENAARFLSQVPEENKFWAHDGKVYSTLQELLSGLKSMKSDTFRFHVNPEKNDFSNWIYDIIGDTELAEELRKVRDKKSTETKISNRVKSLKKLN
jgi:hypothetical protein